MEGKGYLCPDSRVWRSPRSSQEILVPRWERQVAHWRENVPLSFWKVGGVMGKHAAFSRFFITFPPCTFIGQRPSPLRPREGRCGASVGPSHPSGGERGDPPPGDLSKYSHLDSALALLEAGAVPSSCSHSDITRDPNGTPFTYQSVYPGT